MLVHVADCSWDPAYVSAILALVCKNWNRWLCTPSTPEKHGLYVIIWTLERPYNPHEEPLRDLSPIISSDRPDLLGMARGRNYFYFIQSRDIHEAARCGAIRFLDYVLRKHGPRVFECDWIRSALAWNRRDTLQWAFDHGFELESKFPTTSATSGYFGTMRWLIKKFQCPYRKKKLLKLAETFGTQEDIDFVSQLH